MVVVGCAEAVIAIFLPPLAVALRTGCSGSLLLNILLTILGWIPGVIHAWIVILARPGLRDQHKARRRGSYVVEERRTHVGDGYGHHSHHHHHGGARPRSRSRARSRSAVRPSHERVVYREPVHARARSRSRGPIVDPYYGETGYVERRRKY